MTAQPDVIDAEHLAHQREWSTETFGPGDRTLGVIDHIRKELAEIEADPNDLSEWVDVLILAFDGAWRAGWEPQEIINAVKAKQAKNERRTWPDWRTANPDEAIEHVRGIRSVGIDLDGCVFDFVSNFQMWIHKSTGRPLESLPYADNWDFHKTQWGMTTPEFLDAMQAGVTAGHVFAKGEPSPGAIEALQAFRDAGLELHIITHRPQVGADELTRQWLEEEKIPFDSLTFSADKTIVPVDIFIEDNMDNYIALEAAGRHPVLMDRPWNRDLTTARRVGSWQEFADYVLAKTHVN